MKILVVAPSWVGDMMMSHSLYQLLKQKHPNATIDVLAPSWCKPLLARMPEVNKAIHMPVGHKSIELSVRYRIAKELAKTKYDQAIILPNSFKSALIPSFAYITKRTGWRGEMRYGLLNDLRILDKNKYPQMVQRYAALAFPKDQQPDFEQVKIPYPHLTVTPKQIIESQAAFCLAIDPERKIIGLCPGAEFGPAKCWPHYHYAELAKQLIAQNYAVYLFGSAKDQDTCQLIFNLLNQEQQEFCTNLAGKTKLIQAIDLLATCSAVVSNDSGLMHIAAALALPVVALYGPTSPEFAPPLTDKKRILRTISAGHLKIRRGTETYGYHKSMIDLSPDLVMQELCDLLA